MEQINQDQSYMTIFIISVGIILLVLSVINIVGITLHYYHLKEEIDELEDKDLKVDLLHHLRTIGEIFVMRLFYHTEQDFFDSHRSYCRLQKFRHITSTEMFYQSIKVKDREEVAESIEEIHL